MRRPVQTLWRAGLAVGALLLAALLVGSAAGAPAEAPDLGYAKDVSWHLDDAPELAGMERTIHAVLARVHVTYAGVDGTPVEGFFPGMTYQYRQVPGSTPFYVYIRDTATVLPTARYYYGAAALSSVVEEFFRLQYPDGAISATVSPDDVVDKATVTSDEETSGILAAAEVVRGLGDSNWLNQRIHGQAVIERLNRAMRWLLNQRVDPGTRLIKRGHTTDWGDVKWEMSGPDPTHMQPGDQWTVSIYDQAIAFAALRALAQLNAAVGRDQDAAAWLAAADDLRQATNAVLWQDDPERGYYRIHVHLEPDTIQHDYDEGAIVAIGNAAAVYYGLADADQVARILAALERARMAAPAPKPGLTLEPAYPDWRQVQMDQRVYQNGALWDWWAGRQISGEFWSGYSSLAREHLLEVARDWATHPGRVREWESPWLGRTGAEQAYGGAASVVGQAVIEGLFGVDLSGRALQLMPRLGDRSGGIRVYEPATDVYVAYEYQPGERQLSMRYGTNTPTAVTLRLQVGWRGDSVARLDGQDVLPISYEQVGEERVARVMVPSGTHRVDVHRAAPKREAF